jgi:Protein of Unknown function (DUF2784)
VGLHRDGPSPLAVRAGVRRHAGQAGYQGGFISHYLVKVIYPPGLTRSMQIGLGLLVLLVAVTGYRGFLRRHPPGQAWLQRWPLVARQEHGAEPEHERAVRP